MADDADNTTENNGKGSKAKLIIIIAVVLALVIGGALFFVLSAEDAPVEEVVPENAGAVSSAILFEFGSSICC